MSTPPLTSKPRRWYREPYVWLIILFPLAAVIGGLTTLWIAERNWDGVVVDDYYEKGLEINRVLDRDHAATRYGLKGVLQMHAGPHTMRITLTARQGFSAPRHITVRFLNHTRGGFDRKATLNEVAPMVYEGPRPNLIRGDWYVQIEAADWRLLDDWRQ